MVRSFSTADYLPKNYLLYIQLLFAMILISFLPCLNKMPDWMLPDFFFASCQINPSHAFLGKFETCNFEKLHSWELNMIKKLLFAHLQTNTVNAITTSTWQGAVPFSRMISHLLNTFQYYGKLLNSTTRLLSSHNILFLYGPFSTSIYFRLFNAVNVQY